MTLLIGGVTSEFGIVLSDRRLTSNGRVVDDEVNKMTAYLCADAKIVFTFTGLARAGRFETASWISSFLVRNSEPERHYLPVRRRMVDSLTNQLRQISAPPETKRLSILVTGYHYSTDEEFATAILTRISNFEEGNNVRDQAEDLFHVEDATPRRLPSKQAYLFSLAGTTRGVDPSVRAQLQSLLLSGVPGRGVADKALELGLAAAESPLSRGAIGKSWSSAVIFSHPRDPIWVQYHAPTAVREHWAANLVDATGPHPVIGLSNMMVETKEPAAHSFPGTPRNATCPCGSGKKYKKCHGGSYSSRGGAYLNRLFRENDEDHWHDPNLHG